MCISSNIIFACINTRENTTDVAGRNLWLKCHDNLISCFLASEWVGPSIPFAEDYFCITETFVGGRDERELEARVKLRSRAATAKGACKCSPLPKLVGLGLFIQLRSNFLIPSISHLHVVIERRGLC